MSDIEKMLLDVVYGSVGVVASALEATGDLAKTFVEKGHETVRQGQAKAEEIRQAIHEACVRETGIDLTQMTREQRDALRRDLETMAAADRERTAEKNAAEEPVEEPVEEAAESEADMEESEEEPDDDLDDEEGNG